MRRLSQNDKINEHVCQITDVPMKNEHGCKSFLMNKIAAALFRVIDDEEYNQVLAAHLITPKGAKGWFLTFCPLDESVRVSNYKLKKGEEYEDSHSV